MHAARGLESDPAHYQAGASFPLVSSLSTHENCVCVCVCLHAFVCIHPTSAIVGKGGLSFLLLCLELSQERLGRPKRDPSIDRESPSLSYCMAVLAHTDLQWCLLMWQHIHQIAIHLRPPHHLPVRHPQRGHPLFPVGPQRDAWVSAGRHLAPFRIWLSRLHPHCASPPQGC